MSKAGSTWAMMSWKTYVKPRGGAATPFFPLPSVLNPQLYEGRVQVCFYT